MVTTFNPEVFVPFAWIIIGITIGLIISTVMVDFQSLDKRKYIKRLLEDNDFYQDERWKNEITNYRENEME